MSSRRATRRTIATAGIASIATGLIVATLGVTVGAAGAAPPEKVTICHSTSSTTNPYNEVSVAVSAIDDGGANDHSQHTGGEFDFTNPSENDGWGDIIPPVGDYPGLNWTATGQAIHAAGCSDPADPGPCDYDPSIAADDEACEPPVEPCEHDDTLTADDEACVPPVEPDPCQYNPSLGADDEGCVPPTEPDPCAYDDTLAADDEACVPPTEPDPCEFDDTLTADDEGCVPPVEPDPCAYDDTLTADDETCVPPTEPDPCELPMLTAAAEGGCDGDVDGEVIEAPDPSTPDEPAPSDPPAPTLAGLPRSDDALGGTVVPQALPRTGGNVGPLATTSISLILVGVSLLVAQRRLRPRPQA